MRKYIPIVIKNGKGIKYEPLTIEKAINFANRLENKNQSVIFETESFGTTYQLKKNDLIKLL